VAFAIGSALAASAAFAHHAPGTLGTVRITDRVTVGGVPLQPGVYEIRDTGEHPNALPGQSPDSRTWVEFVEDGKVVARDGAELVDAASRSVATRGQSSTAPLRVDRLKGNEFVRISTNRDGSRYLIYLPLIER